MPPLTAPGVGRITVDQFDAFIDAGVFSEDARIDLIAGRIYPRMPAKQPHNIVVLNLAAELRSLLTAGFYVAEEKPVQWSPLDRAMPDVAVVRGKPSDYPDAPPGPESVPLVFEVCDTTCAYDRTVALAEYAAARFAAYGIVDVRGRSIEVHTDLRGRGRRARYARCEGPFGVDGEAPLWIDGEIAGRLPVRDVFAGVRGRARRSRDG